jgi:hypothetical protein
MTDEPLEERRRLPDPAPEPENEPDEDWARKEDRNGTEA